MANGVYIGVNNVARKVKKIYIGINGVARKVKKAYIGVNGVAKLFYQAIQYISFTSSPAPTSWSGGNSDIINHWTGTNSYGNWEVYASQPAYSSSRTVDKAFDNNTSSSFLIASTQTTATSSAVFLYLKLPNNVKINPTKFYLQLGNFGGTESSPQDTLIQGSTDGSSWTTLYTQSARSQSVTTYQPTITTSTYFSYFRVRATNYNSNYRVYVSEFKVVSGTIEDAR